MKLHLHRISSSIITTAIFLSAATRSCRAFRPTVTTAAFTRRYSSSASTCLAMQPPTARRDETSVIWAGKLKDEDNPNKLARQSETSKEPLLDPPKAVSDPYGWMRDETRENEEILNHLNAENAYTESLTSHLEPLRQTLYDEMVASIQETDYSLPRPKNADWVYYGRTIQGKSYTVHCRAPRKSMETSKEWDLSPESPILEGEEIVLDVNALADGRKYCATGHVKTSPSHNLLAYSVDFVGGETCELHVIDLATREMVDHDPKLEISGEVVWGSDDSTLFYIKMDEAHRPYQVYKRIIGSDKEDELLFEEPDELFWLGISKSLDGKYFFIESGSKETSEYHFLDLMDSESKLQCVAPRRTKVLYDVEHREGQWWIASNVGGTPNMRLLTAPAEANSADSWTDVTIEGDEKLFDGSYTRCLDQVECFKTHVVAQGREGGIPRVWIISLDNDKATKMEMLTFDEEAHDVGMHAHYEYDTDSIVVSYDSMITPPSSLEILLADPSGERKVLKTRAVPGYDKSLYACDRTTVTSRDGTTEIPVSMVYRKDTMETHLADGKTPVHTHLYGYGSYGSCCEADFRATRLTLLNRGIIFCIAHVRGGGEMGRQWYEEPNGAKYMCKQNTFHDFVDVAKWLIDDKKLTKPDFLSCEGRSAGGLLIGASINQAPELFRMAVLGVPFVDVVPTMIDASIPLTAVEWEEWGCPNEVKYFDYMMEYSPINNVKPGSKYPACLLTGGLHDPRVQYWEPSKFAAELRHQQQSNEGDANPVCVKMDMTAGHFSASDRYKYLKELAFDYAFLLDQVGIADK